MIETISGTVKEVREYIATKGLADEAQATLTAPLAELSDERFVMMDVKDNEKVECMHEAETHAACSELHAVHRREKYGDKPPGAR